MLWMLNLEEAGSIDVDGGVVPRFSRVASVAVQRRHKLVTPGSQAFYQNILICLYFAEFKQPSRDNQVLAGG